MDALSYKTQFVNKNTAGRKWLLIDAQGQVLGRLCSRITFLLRGKHKPSFAPHVDCGDSIVVINADKIRLTGKKWDKKEIIHHTGYPGGQIIQSPKKIHEKHPTRLIELAVKGMVPKNRMGRELFRHLYVYAGTEHPHTAQNPEPYTINI